MSIKLGSHFRFPHPKSGTIEIWEAMNIMAGCVELKAVTGTYPNDLARTVTVYEGDLKRHRLLSPEEFEALSLLEKSNNGHQTCGIVNRRVFEVLVDEKLATYHTPSLDMVVYEISPAGRRILAEQAPYIAATL